MKNHPDYIREQLVDLMQQLHRASMLNRGFEEPERSAYRTGVVTAIHIFEDYLGLCSHPDCQICKLEESD